MPFPSYLFLAFVEESGEGGQCGRQQIAYWARTICAAEEWVGKKGRQARSN